MSKPSLKITITIHEDGSITVDVEWCRNLSAGVALAGPPRWG